MSDVDFEKKYIIIQATRDHGFNIKIIPILLNNKLLNN